MIKVACRLSLLKQVPRGAELENVQIAICVGTGFTAWRLATFLSDASDA
jgi:hypothetical protein